MTDDDTKPLDLSAAGIDEVQRLREQVAQLESQLAAKGAESEPSPRQGGRWRSPVVTLMVLVAALLAPLSVVANWSRDMVSDTDRYVATVGPLASNPQVQKSIATRITNEIVDKIDVDAVTADAVKALTDRGLNPQLANSLSLLANPLTAGITNIINDQVTKVVTSDSFQEAWDAANREAHDQLVVVLTGKDSGSVTVDDGAVRVNLAATINTIKATLVDNGFQLAERIPTVNATFTILQSKDLAKAQSAFRVLNVVAPVLPWLAVALLLGAVFLSRNRRRTLIIGALAFAASMLLLRIGLEAGRNYYLDALPSDVNPSTAGVVFDQIIIFIRQALRAVLALSLVVALIAWVSGPGRAATGLRAGITNLIALVRGRSGLNTGGFGESVWTYRNPIRGTVLGVAFLLYVLADHPTAKLTIWLAIIAALILLVIEVIAQQPVEMPATATTSGHPHEGAEEQAAEPVDAG